ncbi:hypothetical protein ZWY2020_032727 [Hordeum vulgare]|nr:hypothetical protein ZWY2020_032727 [Hordeum vulgare]
MSRIFWITRLIILTKIDYWITIFFYSEFYSQILSEGFAIVVEIPFSLHCQP